MPGRGRMNFSSSIGQLRLLLAIACRFLLLGVLLWFLVFALAKLFPFWSPIAFVVLVAIYPLLSQSLRTKLRQALRPLLYPVPEWLWYSLAIPFSFVALMEYLAYMICSSGYTYRMSELEFWKLAVLAASGCGAAAGAVGTLLALVLMLLHKAVRKGTSPGRPRMLRSPPCKSEPP